MAMVWNVLTKLVLIGLKGIVLIDLLEMVLHLSNRNGFCSVENDLDRSHI